MSVGFLPAWEQFDRFASSIKSLESFTIEQKIEHLQRVAEQHLEKAGSVDRAMIHEIWEETLSEIEQQRIQEILHVPPIN